MARMFQKKKSRSGLLTIAFVVIILALLLVAWQIAGSIQRSHDKEELNIIRQAVIRATVQCYSLESRYPPDLKYLEDNYGVSIDHSLYIVHYRVVGQNIMPDVRLFRVGK